MSDYIKEVTWKALEHSHGPQEANWLWALGILTVSATGAALLLGNSLFAFVILISGIVMGIIAVREPNTVPFAVSQRGLRIEDKLYPYSTLECFYIDEENPWGPQLLARSEKMFMPLIVMPLPEEYVDEIEDIIASRLPEEYLEIPFFQQLLDFFGF